MSIRIKLQMHNISTLHAHHQKRENINADERPVGKETCHR